MEVLAVTSLVATAASGGLQAYASYQEGKELQRQAEFQAEEARKQAKLEQDRANIAQLQGEQETARRMRAYSQEVGSVYANAAGNGILIDSGSAGDTLGKALDTSAISAAEDVSTIRDNTALTIWTHQANKSQLLRSAENYKKQGKAAYRSGILGATAIGIGTVGKVAKGAVAIDEQFGTFSGGKKGII
jgi:hypothetical protein